MGCDNKLVNEWVKKQAELLQPDKIVWINGSDTEYKELCNLLVATKVFTQLDNKEYPDSYWSVSHPSDVARVEGRTYICSLSEADAGPTNNWRNPKEMREHLTKIMAGCMKGRTMYVLPYMMGPVGSPYSKVGFELTDSAYVVANMRIMARVGDVALKALGPNSSDFVRGVHSTGTLDPEERYIVHYPETREIVSFNTGYGGNALQCKKCFALRIASVQARDEGWLAEHMLILGITNPKGEKKYFCAAFPSACGKTNLAMLVPPEEYLKAGWKIETVGDDIAWLNFGKDGRLYAINPEAGFFGVAPGTSMKTNPNVVRAIKKGNCIFTNTALDIKTMTPWWEGFDGPVPKKVIDWLGHEWHSEGAEEPAAHANSRFTCPANQCPCIDPLWESPEGVPISAIIFGGRRAKAAPLVYEAFNWQHGTFVGLTMASETTAAAIGEMGRLRRDPMAMRPFIGYHVGDYLQHWLNVGKKQGAKLPSIFHVNWFKKDDAGKFMWPGFGENIRALEWIFRRTSGEVEAKNTELGLLPKLEDLNLAGANLKSGVAEELFKIDKEEWREDVESQVDFLKSIGEKLPKEMFEEQQALKARLKL